MSADSGAPTGKGSWLPNEKENIRIWGRKPILSEEQVSELRAKLANGAKVATLAREYGVSRQTIYAGLSTVPRKHMG